MRQNTEVVLWIFGIMFPSIITFLFREYGLEMITIYINVILPTLPYIILALICRIADKIKVSFIIGAAVTAAIVQIFLYGWSWIYHVIQHAPGGANIGLGILFVIMPAYLPVIMALGGVVGSIIGRGNDEANT